MLGSYRMQKSCFRSLCRENKHTQNLRLLLKLASRLLLSTLTGKKWLCLLYFRSCHLIFNWLQYALEFLSSWFVVAWFRQDSYQNSQRKMQKWWWAVHLVTYFTIFLCILTSSNLSHWAQLGHVSVDLSSFGLSCWLLHSIGKLTGFN